MRRAAGPFSPKPALRWTGILFAFAANVLLVTLADALVRRGGALDLELVATVAAPLLAGILTALYTRARGGMHAFVGGLLSLPVLAWVIFAGQWPWAIFAAAFCTLGGALTEIIIRRAPPR